MPLPDFLLRRLPPLGQVNAELRPALPWLLLAVLLALVPAWLQLPGWLLLPALLPLALKGFSAWRGVAFGRWPVPLLLALDLALLFAAWPRLGAGHGVLAGFTLVLTLQCLQLRTRRDALVLLLGCCVLSALALVRMSDALSLLLALVLAPVLLLNLARLLPQVPLLPQGGLVLAALPLALLLFFAVPRIPGPLWDFGLALGLPIGVSLERGSGGLGAESTMAPAAPRQGGAGDGTALVAEFDGWVPPVSQLYWRGPVLYRFDGAQWQAADPAESRGKSLTQGFRSAAQWQAEWIKGGREVAYQLRLAGHGKRWLYALDMPLAPAAESYLTQDYQLMSMTPLRSEVRYRAVARLNAQVGKSLSPERRELALAYPAGHNPQLQALGRKLAANQPQPRAIALAALELFAKGGFRYNDRAAALPGAHPYDEFVLQRREGGSELFAASYALLLRAAGVPTRIVTGFRGGRLMALTDYVLVKESNTYAWVEAWLPGEGWVRFDPTDAVAPQRFTGRSQRAATVPAQPAARPQTASPAAADAHAPAAAAANPPASQPPAPAVSLAGQWLAGLDKWVIHYDLRRQRELFAGDSGQPAAIWPWLVGALLLPVSALAGWLGWRQRSRQRRDPLAAAWLQLCRRLQRAGIAVDPADCPLTLSRRLAGNPATQAAAELLLVYAGLRYGSADAALQATFLRALHHFRQARLPHAQQGTEQ